MDFGFKNVKNVVKGAEIQVNYHNKNLTHAMFHGNDRVLRAICRTRDKYSSRIMHVDGVENIGGDSLSRLPTNAPTAEQKDFF